MQLTLCQHARNIYVPPVLFGILYHETKVPYLPMTLIIWDGVQENKSLYRMLYEQKNRTRKLIILTEGASLSIFVHMGNCYQCRKIDWFHLFFRSYYCWRKRRFVVSPWKKMRMVCCNRCCCCVTLNGRRKVWQQVPPLVSTVDSYWCHCCYLPLGYCLGSSLIDDKVMSWVASICLATSWWIYH